MTSAWLASATAWISAHPLAAGALIFIVAFCDAVIVLGIVVPALPLLFAVGTLIGLGHVNGPYAVASAALGAFTGDGMSYWIGRRWGPQLRTRGPFARWPQWLERGEAMFKRHGTKSIFTARFVGAVRPFVPAIAGMLHVPTVRYLVADVDDRASLASSVGFDRQVAFRIRPHRPIVQVGRSDAEKIVVDDHHLGVDHRIGPCTALSDRRIGKPHAPAAGIRKLPMEMRPLRPQGA